MPIDVYDLLLIKQYIYKIILEIVRNGKIIIYPEAILKLMEFKELR